VSCLAIAALTATGVHALDGAAVYKSKCSACHDSGAGDAPRTAVASDWTGRFAAGRAALYAAAIDGIPNTAMAPKGGFVELSADEVRAAVDHMLARTGYVDSMQDLASVARAAGPKVAPDRTAASQAQLPDADVLRQIAEALRDAIAPPGTAIEAHNGELVIRGSGVRVGIDAGVVRLVGVVANGATIKRAEEAARRVAGTRRIENRLIAGGMLDFD
jgi:cytochrome c5